MLCCGVVVIIIVDNNHKKPDYNDEILPYLRWQLLLIFCQRIDVKHYFLYLVKWILLQSLSILQNMYVHMYEYVSI